jgi:hypothetical protein
MFYNCDKQRWSAFQSDYPGEEYYNESKLDHDESRLD